MIRRPPRSTRTDTLLPYTTLFRSLVVEKNARLGGASAGYDIAPGFRAPRFAHLLPALPVRLERELDLAAHGLAYARRDLPTLALAADGRHVTIEGGRARLLSGAEHPEAAAFAALRGRLDRKSTSLNSSH